MRAEEYVTPPLEKGGIKVKWEGNFSLDLVYKRMKYWFDFNGYKDNFEEEEYLENRMADKKEIGIRWYAEKEAGGYFGYVVRVNFLLTKLKEVEMMKDNIPYKMNNGTITIKVAGHVVKDIKNKYKSKMAQKIYEKFIAKTRIDDHKAKLYGDVYELVEEIKKFLVWY